MLCQKLNYWIDEVGNSSFFRNQHGVNTKTIKISQIIVESVLAALDNNVGALNLSALDELFLGNADVTSLSDKL